MSKAILLSIHPKWAKKIYSGEKKIEWRNLWAEVERKCRAKAEEYK